MKWHLPMWEKQAWALDQATKKIKKYGGVGALLEMGTGKTRIAIHIIEDLIRNEEARMICVTAPLSVLRVWTENWHEWSSMPMLFVDLHDTGPKGLALAARMSQHQPVICLINYESAWQMGSKRQSVTKRDGSTKIERKKIDTALDNFEWDIFILDESTAIKTPGSKVSRFMRTKIAKRSRYRMILTGSAYIKRPLDVWAQIQFVLNPAPEDNWFPRTFEMFKHRYTIPHPYIRGAIKGYQNLDDLVRRLNRPAILLKKEDVLDLPPVTHEVRYVKLSPKTKKLYDELTQNQFIELETLEKEGQTVTAAHIFTMLQKQVMLTSGFLITDPELDPETDLITKREIVRVGNEKLNELLSELEDRDDPTIIVVNFDEEERIVHSGLKAKFGVDAKILNGSVKGSEARHRLVAEAAQDRFFIVKESVGAKGLDMRWADMTIWFSHRQHTEDYDQMMARNHRGGQTKKITYRHLLAEDTIDEKILRSLQNDINLAGQLEKDWRKLFDR